MNNVVFSFSHYLTNYYVVPLFALTSFLVDRVDDLFVVPVHYAALHLLRGRHLAPLEREIMFEQRHLPRHLIVRKTGACAEDFLVHLGYYSGILDQLGAIGP